jgi:hypothetical protein
MRVLTRASLAAVARAAAAIERAPGAGWLFARRVAVAAPPGVSSVRHYRVAHAGSLGLMGASPCVQRYVLSPSCSRVSLASFSSGDGSEKGSAESIELNGRLAASASVRELLSVVRASHQDFDAVNLATSWNKLAKLPRRSVDAEDVANALELLSKDTTRMANANAMPQAVGNTLFSIGKLAEQGVIVDVVVVRAVTDAAARVANDREPQGNSMQRFFNSKSTRHFLDKFKKRYLRSRPPGHEELVEYWRVN